MNFYIIYIYKPDESQGYTYLLSQMTAFRSKWLVGSSSSNNVGSMNKALQREGSADFNILKKVVGNLFTTAGQKEL